MLETWNTYGNIFHLHGLKDDLIVNFLNLHITCANYQDHHDNKYSFSQEVIDYPFSVNQFSYPDNTVKEMIHDFAEIPQVHALFEMIFWLGKALNRYKY